MNPRVQAALIALIEASTAMAVAIVAADAARQRYMEATEKLETILQEEKKP